MNVFYPEKNSGQASGVKCYGSRKEVEKEASNYVKIIKVDGGWMTFETWTDYEVWTKQK